MQPDAPSPPERLTVTAEHAPGAEASIEGGPFERLPVVDRLVGRGLRRLVVRAPGFRTFQTAVVVMDGSSLVFAVTPDELPPLMGVLVVEPRGRFGPSGPSVTVDGARIDGPPYALPVTAGQHRVEVSGGARGPSGADVVVEADATMRVVIDLDSRYPSPLAVGFALALLAAAAGAGVAYSRRGR